MQSRITITIPPDLIEAADAKAKALGRSRSWVLVEALRRYLAERSPRGAVREPAATYTAGLGPYRQVQLEADLSLSPEQRVKEAQRTAKAGPYTTHAKHDQFLTFDSFEAYIDWKRTQDLR
jgi:predicted transcriptional regulator